MSQTRARRVSIERTPMAHACRLLAASHCFSLLQTLKNMIEDTGTEEAIPLPNVTGKILSKVRLFSHLPDRFLTLFLAGH
jgi:hypothetical protein